MRKLNQQYGAGGPLSQSSPHSAELCTCSWSSADVTRMSGCSWAVQAQHQGSLQPPKPEAGSGQEVGKGYRQGSSSLRGHLTLCNATLSNKLGKRGERSCYKMSVLLCKLPKVQLNITCWWEVENSCFLSHYFHVIFTFFFFLHFSLQLNYTYLNPWDSFFTVFCPLFFSGGSVEQAA